MLSFRSNRTEGDDSSDGRATVRSTKTNGVNGAQAGEEEDDDRPTPVGSIRGCPATDLATHQNNDDDDADDPTSAWQTRRSRSRSRIRTQTLTQSAVSKK